MSKIIIFYTLATLVVVGLTQIQTAQAHRSGCHAWHSCASDSGSYSCGDTGHSNYCGRSVAPVVIQSAPPIPVSQPTSTGRVGLTIGMNIHVVSTRNNELVKVPTDNTDRVDIRGTYGAVFSKGWRGIVLDATSDGAWYLVDLYGKQSGWTKANALRAINPTSTTDYASLSFMNDRSSGTDKNLTVIALDNVELRKWPSDEAVRVDSRGTFGAVMATGWTGKIIDSTPDCNWYLVELNGNQSGWANGEYLKVIN